MIPKKPVPHLMRDGHRFSEKIMRHEWKDTHVSGPLFISSGDLIADRRYDFARAYAADGDLSAAADLYAQAVELAPGFASAWFALGEAREALGDGDAARAAFERATAADPEDR